MSTCVCILVWYCSLTLSQTCTKSLLGPHVYDNKTWKRLCCSIYTIYTLAATNAVCLYNSYDNDKSIQVSIQLPTSADNVTLPTYASCWTPCCCCAWRTSLSNNVSCKRCPQQQIRHSSMHVGGGRNQKVDGPIPPIPPLWIQLGGLKERCKLPQWVRVEPGCQTCNVSMQLSFLESEKEPFLETTGIGSQARTAHSGSQTGVLSHHSQVCCHHSMWAERPKIERAEVKRWVGSGHGAGGWGAESEG